MAAEKYIHLVPELCTVHPLRSSAVGIGKKLLPRLLWQVRAASLLLRNLISVTIIDIMTSQTLGLRMALNVVEVIP